MEWKSFYVHYSIRHTYMIRKGNKLPTHLHRSSQTTGKKNVFFFSVYRCFSFSYLVKHRINTEKKTVYSRQMHSYTPTKNSEHTDDSAFFFVVSSFNTSDRLLYTDNFILFYFVYVKVPSHSVGTPHIFLNFFYIYAIHT